MFTMASSKELSQAGPSHRATPFTAFSEFASGGASTKNDKKKLTENNNLITSFPILTVPSSFTCSIQQSKNPPKSGGSLHVPSASSAAPLSHIYAGQVALRPMVTHGLLLSLALYVIQRLKLNTLLIACQQFIAIIIKARCTTGNLFPC